MALTPQNEFSVEEGDGFVIKRPKRTSIVHVT